MNLDKLEKCPYATTVKPSNQIFDELGKNTEGATKQAQKLCM